MNTRFASLSGSLLARKGGAKPAMRPSAMTHGHMLDDLGWDDMGAEQAPEPQEHVPSSIAGLTPAPRPIERDDHVAQPVHLQQRAIAEQFVEEALPEPAAAIMVPVRPLAEIVPLPTRIAQVGGRKAAFTLRLDSERHLNLRLAVAVTGHSAQHLVTHALDQFLKTLPDVTAMAGRLPARSTKRS